MKVVNDNIIVDSDFEYGYVSQVFTEESGVLKNKKLVVPNKDTLNRLIYALRVRLGSNKEEILNYYKRIYLDNYFVDVSDFIANHAINNKGNKHENQTIIHTEGALKRWIEGMYPSYELVNTIKIVQLDEGENKEENHIKIKPYFFKNEYLPAFLGDVKNNVYIVQVASDIQEAIKISYIWDTKGYNIGISDRKEEVKIDITKVNFTQLLYYGSTEINVGKKGSTKIIILQYLKDGIKFTQSLLPL